MALGARAHRRSPRAAVARGSDGRRGDPRRVRPRRELRRRLADRALAARRDASPWPPSRSSSSTRRAGASRRRPGSRSAPASPWCSGSCSWRCSRSTWTQRTRSAPPTARSRARSACCCWTFLTSIALFLGLAFAAQLEAVRAGVPEPRLDVQADGARRARRDQQVVEDRRRAGAARAASGRATAAAGSRGTRTRATPRARRAGRRMPRASGSPIRTGWRPAPRRSRERPRTRPPPRASPSSTGVKACTSTTCSSRSSSLPWSRVRCSTAADAARMSARQSGRDRVRAALGPCRDAVAVERGLAAERHDAAGPQHAPELAERAGRSGR